MGIEADGPANNLVLYSVDAGGTQHLVNDVANGGIPAFYPLVVKSAAAVQGPYTADALANAGNVLTTAGVPCDGSGTVYNKSVTGGTVTLSPAPTATTFYRLDGPRKTQITSIQKSGGNLVITYTGP